MGFGVFGADDESPRDYPDAAALDFFPFGIEVEEDF